MNTDLYSISYVLVSGGAGGFMLSLCYYIVDCKKIGMKFWWPFKVFGMNAITMFVLAEGGTVTIGSLVILYLLQDAIF
jgi:predicted acyltransferase